MSTLTILRLKRGLERTGLSRSTIFILIKAWKFKPPINLAARAVGWLESDISDFIEARIKASCNV